MKRCKLNISSYNTNQVVQFTNWKAESFSVDQHKEITHMCLDLKEATQIE